MQPLTLFIGAQYGSAEPDQRQRPLDQRRAGALVPESHDPPRLGLERGARIAATRFVESGLGDQPLQDRALGRQERVEIRVQQIAALLGVRAPARQNVSALPVGRRAVGERRRGRA